LFLDEIDELPLELQPKFLRVLETGQTKRLGEEGYSQVDFRVIVATKQNLVDLVDRGLFREDLYYRIAVVKIFLPPLRERPEDIPRLARHLARRISDGRVEQLDPETEELLINNEWRGNVRELRNAVERILALGSPEISSGQLNGGRTASSPSRLGKYRDAKDAAIREFTVEYLKNLMAQNDGNLSRAAKAAGLSRNHLRDLLKKNDLY
jgi:DNA-binding NtrC family response regulator